LRRQFKDSITCMGLGYRQSCLVFDTEPLDAGQFGASPQGILEESCPKCSGGTARDTLWARSRTNSSETPISQLSKVFHVHKPRVSEAQRTENHPQAGGPRKSKQSWAAPPRCDPPQLMEAVSQLPMMPIDHWRSFGRASRKSALREMLYLSGRAGRNLPDEKKEEARYGTQLSLSRSAADALSRREPYAATQ